VPGGMFIWDGQFHTWEFVIEQDMTYVNVTIPDENGKERWIEICRAPTASTYLQRLDLHINMALKNRYGAPKHQEDVVVDFVEVEQKTEQLNAIPKPFTARPVLSGAATEGSTVTCDAKV